MDGDQSAKTMDRGASAATKHSDMTEGIHEDAQKDLGGAPAGEKTTGHAGASLFDTTGTIGKQFTTDGAIGGTAQKLGGPFDANTGMIGKQFTEQGGIGGAAKEMLAGSEKNTFQKKE
ncbi:hypothetical protein B0A50_06634 [Salinomyces thailandicus]|uniref:Uncharacterized protein n=1 Tax=Salinomyces thailandicus TaxID=706561 RepID=A0A4U0TR05_9PEZI|nr:hypothetical protein B0A50_06634 [Salinomyces thailandica]